MAGVWDDLKDAFPDESNGSRIVITTRDMSVPLHADSGIFQYKLQLRSTDESWVWMTSPKNKKNSKRNRDEVSNKATGNRK